MACAVDTGGLQLYHPAMDFNAEMGRQARVRSRPRGVKSYLVFFTTLVVFSLIIAFWVSSIREQRAIEIGRARMAEATELVRVGRAHTEAGRFDQATGAMEKALTLLEADKNIRSHPSYPVLVADLAVSHLSLENPDSRDVARAVALLTIAWENSSGSDAKFRARLARDLGFTTGIGGELKTSLSWYREALKLDPDDTNTPKRIKMLEHAATIAPK